MTRDQQAHSDYCADISETEVDRDGRPLRCILPPRHNGHDHTAMAGQRYVHWSMKPNPDAEACPSTIHAEDGELAPEARFSGTFRAPWWEQDRVERVTYCLRCAAMMATVKYFTLDEPSPEVERWIEAKGI